MIGFVKLPDDLARRIANYKREHPQTNADSIRNMTDEKLAAWIALQTPGISASMWLDWLRREAAP